MRVVGFVGSSGTGKSYRSMWVSKENNIDYIIDDGLLISHHKIIAGTSAKKEKTKVGSIKRALFYDESQRNEVKQAIIDLNVTDILILGTSVGMVEKISGMLGLGKAGQYIFIDDVATKEEIRLARRMRNDEGKHVIPVPTFEIKEAFSGYLIDPLKIFKRKNNKTYVADKSIVRPSFSYLGDFQIYDNALCQMCMYAARNCDGIKKVTRVSVESVPGGMIFTIDVIMVYGKNIEKCATNLKNQIKEPIERYTSINIAQTNVNVVKLYVEK